mmetsp:Transcript_3822/g.11232  ORF Transcript_3822/g.11232 Transcript_3822/m.11232 type:complete len:230 (-) Transcript_3822:577-1266(-)
MVLLLPCLQLLLQNDLLVLCPQIPFLHLGLVRLHGALPGELHLDYPLVHAHLLFQVVLLLHFLLPAIELGTIVQILFISLQDIVLLRLLLLEQGVLAQHRRRVLPDDGLLRGRGVGLRGLRHERTFSHSFRINFPREVLELVFVAPARSLQVELLRRRVLGCYPSLLLLQPPRPLRLHLREAGLVDGAGHGQRPDFPADHLRLGDQPRLGLRQAEGLRGGRPPPLRNAG